MSKLTLQQMIENTTREVSEARGKHLEMLAAAYYCATGIPPENAVLVEQYDGIAAKIRWHFEERLPQDGTVSVYLTENEAFLLRDMVDERQQEAERDDPALKDSSHAFRRALSEKLSRAVARARRQG